MLQASGETVNLYSAALVRLRKTFIMVGCFSAAVNVLMFTGPLFMLQLYDRVLSSRSFQTLLFLCVIMVFAYFFLGLYDLLRTRLLSRAAYKLDQEIGRESFATWLRAGMPGAVAARRPLNDLATIRGFMSSPAMLGFFDLPWMPIYLAVVYVIHPWLGTLALFGAVVVTAAALANEFTAHKHYAKAMAMDGAEAMFVDQAYRTSEALVPLGMTDAVLSHWKKMHDEGLAIGQSGSEVTENYSAFSKTFRMLLQSAILGLGGYLVLIEQLSPGLIVATSIIAGRALAPVDQVIGQWRSVVRAREAHRRMTAFMQSPHFAPNVALPTPNGVLAVNGLTKYPPNQVRRSQVPPILQGISFSLEPGDGLGVIGPSASGKSTLARLIVGAWAADSGEVRLDGAALEQWNTDNLGRYIGYLPQSLELLSGTVRENIVRFSENASDEDLIEAANLAGVHHMILGLTDGYNTKIGYGFSGLSGGQLQRIGLARALYGMPKLVVLDEPNSSLDADGDEALTQAILQVRQAGSTVIVMAHRPSAIAAVNKLMVLNDGKIADFGDKADVLRRATRQATDTKPRLAEMEANGNAR